MKRKYSLLYLLPYLVRHKSQMAVGFIMVMLTVVTGMFGPWVLKFVVDDLRQSFDRGKLLEYASIILGISVIEGLFRFWMRKILIGASRDIEYELRNDFFAHIQKMPLSFFHSRSTGDIMSRATNDLNAVRSVLGPGIMYSMTTVVTVMITTAILLSINWKLTLLASFPLALVSVIVKKFGQQIHDRFESIQDQFSALSSKAQENLSGIRVIKAFAREESEIREFSELNEDYVKRSVSLIRLWGVFYPLMSVLIGMSSVSLLWLGGREVVGGRLSLGEFVAFMGYLSLLTWPTIAVGWVINIFQRGAASMDRMLEILHTEPEIRGLPDAPKPRAATGSITIRGLSFRYPGGQREVLRNINLDIPAGRTLAIVGHTGSGKSTLVSLLPRLFDAPPGTICIDGRDIRLWRLRDLRKLIGFVPQETFLFSDTIRENIGFGTDGDLSDEEVAWAARVSQIEHDVEHFPQKYQTFVGERGITLSGGQKQRIAISRAVQVQPRILILDDSLSNVDTDTEERILKELEGMMKERTTILISHRISTVQNADQIIVLQDGSVAEMGDHASLMALQGVYASLHQKQLLEEELATA